MKIKHISIFMPRDTAWYQGIVKQIALGFSAFGVEVSYGCGLLGEEELLLWVKKYNPQLIFEMNRPRGDIPFLPKNIIHVCWLVDFNGRPITDFYGSEITYLFGPKWLEKFPYDSFYRWFGPGACIESYYPDNSSFIYESSFIGHISKPWSNAELSRNISARDKPLLFGDVLPVLEQYMDKFRSELKSPEDYNELLYFIAKEKFNTEVKLDPVLKYDLSGRLIRLLNRRQLINKIINIADLSLFGPKNWEEWPEYKPFYKKFLETSDEMRTVYNASRINLHENGNGMHFRVMDCMASAGLLFVPKNEYDEREGGIKSFFKPDKHYVEFDLEDLHDKYKFYLANTHQAEKIRYAAIEEIKRSHTWMHRVKSIFNDLDCLGYKTV
jgi:hypothetical protein